MNSKKQNQENIKLAELQSRETKSRMLAVQNRFAFALNEWLKYDMDKSQEIAAVLIELIASIETNIYKNK